MSARRTFVIVGASLAGASAALTLRSEGFDGRVILIGEEPDLPYERPPLSKRYLRGEVSFEKTLVRPAAFYADQAIDLRLGVAVTRVNAADRRVECADGDRIPYDAVLVATGGRNRRLNVPGRDLEGVYDLRTRGDADRIRGEIGPGRHAVVVGMGFIGCEVAASLRASGVEVTAIEPERTTLARALGDEVGAAIEHVHRDQGVRLVFGETATRFEGGARVNRVRTSGNRILDCDFVVVGVGLEAATGVVEGTSVTVDNGIVVDERCRSSVPGIFAAGDVANHLHPLCNRHVRVEHWQNALKQGAAAARSMLDKGQPYDELHWFWSDQYDVNLQYAGFHTAWDRLVIRGSVERREFVACYLNGGRLDAAVAVNRAKELRQVMALIRQRAVVDPERLQDPDVDLRAGGE